MFLLSHDYWEVRETPDRGRGVFAKKNIPAGTVIGDYIGTVMRNEDFNEEKHGLYDMYFNKDACIYADKNTTGVHLINHSCSANCDIFPYKGHALFFAIRKIFTGEELTIQYLISPPEKNHVCSHACYCGSPVCHGTMHTTIAIDREADEFIKKVDSEYIEKLPVAYGEKLPALPTYPENIADDPMFDIFGSLQEKPETYPDTAFPVTKEIRKRIRQTGRIIYFSKLNTFVFGIMNDLIICMDSKTVDIYSPETR